MASWIWVLIPLVAIIGAYIIDYQKNKMKWQVKNNQSDKELDEIRKVVFQLKKRVENLEAIATDDTYTGTRSHNPADSIEFDDEEIIRRENRQNVAKKAKSKGEY